MKPAGDSAFPMAYSGIDSSERTQAGSTSFTDNVFGVARSTTSATTR